MRRLRVPDSTSTVPVIDLLDEFSGAEKRPAAGVFEIGEGTFADVRHAGIGAPAPSRVIWTARLPLRGWLRTAVAVLPAGERSATVSFRIEINEPLAQVRVSAGGTRESEWVPLFADLSPYAGRKWSVFYRPDARQIVHHESVHAGRPLRERRTVIEKFLPSRNRTLRALPKYCLSANLPVRRV